MYSLLLLLLFAILLRVGGWVGLGGWLHTEHTHPSGALAVCTFQQTSSSVWGGDLRPARRHCLSSRPHVIFIIIISWCRRAGLVERRVGGGGSAPVARAARWLVRSSHVEVVVARVVAHGANVVFRALALPRPVSRQHRHHLQQPATHPSTTASTPRCHLTNDARCFVRHTNLSVRKQEFV